MRKILMLVQDAKNESVKLLRNSLMEDSYLNKNNEIEIYEVTEKTMYSINKEASALEFRGDYPFPYQVFFKDISLVMKRTWGPIRNKVLEICKIFEEHDVEVFNRCNFIALSRSKNEQAIALKDKSVMPYSLCFDKQAFNSMRLDQNESIKQLIAEVDQNQLLNFPLVVKTAQGCRNDGVYLVETKMN